MNNTSRIDITVSPDGSLDLLSRRERERLRGPSENGLHELLRPCSLAVLNTGAGIDNTKEILEKYSAFDIHLFENDWGLELELTNAPSHAFVNGQMVQGIKEHLFSVFRDIIYVGDMLKQQEQTTFESTSNITEDGTRDKPNHKTGWDNLFFPRT